jgi:hypothetical protein
MQLIKNNLSNIIVLVLVVVIVLQRCGGGGLLPPSGEPKIIRDTAWIVKDSVIISKPQVVKSISVESHDTIINHYIPDTNYQKLVIQYQEVVNQLLTKNIHSDSVRIDTNGYVKIIDTVQKNLIVGRSTEVNVKYPVIKETIIIPPTPVNQLYVGGGIGGTKAAPVSQIKAGLLFKNKKDQIYGVSVGLGISGQPVYGIESYWKLKK